MKDQTNVIQFQSSSRRRFGPAAAGALTRLTKPGKSLWITVGSLFAITLPQEPPIPRFLAALAALRIRLEPGNRKHRFGLAGGARRGLEKSVAESLASVEVRDLASISVGHEATLDEKIRYGILERKYTILHDLQRNEVEAITLQGSDTEPTFVSNRSEFMGKYGRWMSEKYGFSELKSSEVIQKIRVEFFTVFDSNHKPYATAKFELDSFQRLLAFHFEPL